MLENTEGAIKKDYPEINCHYIKTEILLKVALISDNVDI